MEAHAKGLTQVVNGSTCQCASHPMRVCGEHAWGADWLGASQRDSGLVVGMESGQMAVAARISYAVSLPRISASNKGLCLFWRRRWFAIT